MLRVPEGTEGKSCQCPSCGSVSTVPTMQASIGAGPSATNEGAGSEKPADDGLVRVSCPKCQYPLRCKLELMGSKGQCKQCKHIFIIGETSVAAVETTALVFSCPKCDQLFDGKPEMEGRKGKCHSCGEVFPIKLRQADSERKPKIEKSVKPASTPPATQPNPTQPTSSQSKSSQLKAPTADSTANPTSTSSLQLICGSCQGAMEVPSTAAGKTVACPYCQQMLQIPGNEGSSSTPKSSIFDQPSSSLLDSPSAKTSTKTSTGIFDGLDVPTTGSSCPSYPPVDLYGAPPNYQPTSYPPTPYQPTSDASPQPASYPANDYSSPYQSPSSALQQSSYSGKGGNREWLISVASWHRRLALCIATFIISYAVIIATFTIYNLISEISGTGPIHTQTDPPLVMLILTGIVFIVSIVAGTTMLISYIVLCTKIFETSTAMLYIVGYFVGCCVPFLPLILMIVILSKASGVLRSYGISVGVFGSSDVK
jgi:hypothetical protein